MTLDTHRSEPSLDGRQNLAASPDLAVDVDWAPAYELALSLSTFVCLGGAHHALELGPSWATSVSQLLPSDVASRFTRKSVVKAFKDNDADLLVLLILACPGERDVPAFLDWFSQLTGGAAYEAVAPYLPESVLRLPRDFSAWRDAILDMLGAWNTAYFRHIDTAVIDGLRREADVLRQRLGTRPSVQLIEEVTNGLVVEPSADLRAVTLVPQHHHRPYIHYTEKQRGLVLLYPCDAVPSPPDVPPPGLVRLTRALSDESRLRILRFLANGPSTLTEVARFAGLSQPTVHHHLTALRTAGLVRIHFFAVSTPNRYSLRPHALEQLSRQLSSYLEPADQ